MAAAGSGKTFNAFFENGKLAVEAAVGFNIAGSIVGDCVTAAPIAVGVPRVAEHTGEESVVFIVPFVCFIRIVGSHSARTVEELAAVLRFVNKACPVVSAGEVFAALVIGILEGENAKVVVLALRRKCRNCKKAEHHHYGKQQ